MTTTESIRTIEDYIVNIIAHSEGKKSEEEAVAEIREDATTGKTMISGRPLDSVPRRQIAGIEWADLDLSFAGHMGWIAVARPLPRFGPQPTTGYCELLIETMKGRPKRKPGRKEIDDSHIEATARALLRKQQTKNKRKAVHEALVQHGYEVGDDDFEKALARITRKGNV